LITLNGKTHIKRYLASIVPAIARSIAFGIGGSAESVSDTKLGFEVGRSQVRIISYDFVNNKLIFKAEVDALFGGTIYEVALFSSNAADNNGQYSSKVLATFDSTKETWQDATTSVAGTYVTTNTRIGTDSLSHTPSASTSKTDIAPGTFLDFSGYSGADKFVFAYYVNNANTSNIKFRFGTDAANYYEFALGAQTAGYKVIEVAKSTATVTGTPSWSNITEIRVTTTSGAGGASAVNYDGIRIEDMDSATQDSIMVSRELLSTPFTKVEGKVQEIEFSLDVSV
jgi:hypothetical protein